VGVELAAALPVPTGREQHHAKAFTTTKQEAADQGADGYLGQNGAQVAGARQAGYAEGGEKHAGASHPKEQGGDRGTRQQSAKKEEQVVPSLSWPGLFRTISLRRAVPSVINNKTTVVISLINTPCRELPRLALFSEVDTPCAHANRCFICRYPGSATYYRGVCLEPLSFLLFYRLPTKRWRVRII
jgi:hypothetical protein